MPRSVICVALLFAAFIISPPAHAQDPDSAAAKPLATRNLDVEGIRAEVIESVRKGNLLTVRVRLRNTGTEPAKLMLAQGGASYHTANYIVAGDTRYDIIRDTNGNVTATPRDGGGWLQPTIPPKGTFMWWASYAAPPASIKSYTLYLRVGPPIEDIPIIDK
jgi:hypothetical protein